MMKRRTLLATSLALFGMRASAAENERRVPPAAYDESQFAQPPATAILAGGCFWGVQGVYQRTEGVLSAVSGYAGGGKWEAKYGLVSSGKTNHAEAVQLTYDPATISYGKLLQIFFTVVHDPTQLNRQGPDIGRQYRSAIFPLSSEHARIARAYITQIDQADVFDTSLATAVEENQSFYPAEDYHQDYLVTNPRALYILLHDIPKLEALKRAFPEFWREKPVLVGAPRRLGRKGTGSEAFYRGLPGKD